MISGFNTDVEYSGITYHVQTEDKGLARPIILSLVYDRGTILASKRLPYDDLLLPELDEKALMERLQKQHKLMCAAIRAGRLEDLKKMTEREAHNGNGSGTSVTRAEPEETAEQEGRTETAISSPEDEEAGSPIPMPELAAVPFEPEELPMVGVISIIEDLRELTEPEDAAAEELSEFVIPGEAVEIVSNLAGTERPGNEKLSIEILGDEKLIAGELKSFCFMVCRGSSRRVIGDAEIMVKILGSNFRPKIYHTITDNNGIARIDIELPSFTTGRAALLVRVLSNGEEVELRRSISHK